MSTATRSRFLDLAALTPLQHMRFTTRHRIEGAYTGRHRSRIQGGAGEFVDHREYVGGDDLRRLDWKVLARTGRHYLRLYQDETNLRCTMAIDGSRSMEFGRKGSKLEYAQYLCTALSHLIAQQRDQVGLALLAQGLEAHVPPAGTASHVLRIQELIENIATRPVTDLAGGLRTLFQQSQRRGLLFVVSDFIVDDLEAAFGGIRLFRHRHWEVVVLHLVHPLEEKLPDGLAYRFEGLENEGVVDCSPAEIRARYEARFAAHLAAVRSLALAAGCDYRRVSTAVPYLQTLGGFLVERSG